MVVNSVVLLVHRTLVGILPYAGRGVTKTL